MRRALIAAIIAAGLTAACTPHTSSQRQGASPAVSYDCDGFDLSIVRADGTILVQSGSQKTTLRQSRQDPLRYEGSGALAIFAPNRTFLEWTVGGATATCIADG